MGVTLSTPAGNQAPAEDGNNRAIISHSNNGHKDTHAGSLQVRDVISAESDVKADDLGISQPARVYADSWSPETKAWHDFLVKMCPTLAKDSQRVLIELQGATTESVGHSSINSKHVAFGCTAAVVAIKDEALKGLGGRNKTILIVSLYRAQADLYGQTLDGMTQYGLLSRTQRRRIVVRAVDGSQGVVADFVILDFVQTMHPCPIVWDRRRIRLALTRSRQADMILMSRGIFVNTSAPKDLPGEHDLLLPEKIYEDVARRGGIVTKNAADSQGRGTPVELTSQPKHIPYVNRCRNCNQLGHREKQCLAPLRCGNCEKLGHTPKRCPLPHVPWCYICRSTEHREEDCDVCSICGQRGHKGKSCVVNVEARAGGRIGRKKKNRSRKENSHELCNFCATAENLTKRCPIRRKCKVCGQLGHRKKHCPKKWCRLCQEFGHSHPVCPKRREFTAAGSVS